MKHDKTHFLNIYSGNRGSWNHTIVKLFEDYCALLKCEKYGKSKALSSYGSWVGCFTLVKGFEELQNFTFHGKLMVQKKVISLP